MTRSLSSRSKLNLNRSWPATCLMSLGFDDFFSFPAPAFGFDDFFSAPSPAWNRLKAAAASATAGSVSGRRLERAGGPVGAGLEPIAESITGAATLGEDSPDLTGAGRCTVPPESSFATIPGMQSLLLSDGGEKSSFKAILDE